MRELFRCSSRRNYLAELRGKTLVFEELVLAFVAAYLLICVFGAIIIFILKVKIWLFPPISPPIVNVHTEAHRTKCKFQQLVGRSAYYPDVWPLWKVDQDSYRRD